MPPGPSAASSTSFLQAPAASLITQDAAVVPSLPPPTGVKGALLSYSRTTSSHLAPISSATTMATASAAKIPVQGPCVGMYTLPAAQVHGSGVVGDRHGAGTSGSGRPCRAFCRRAAFWRRVCDTPISPAFCPQLRKRQSWAPGSNRSAPRAHGGSGWRRRSHPCPSFCAIICSATVIVSQAKGQCWPLRYILPRLVVTASIFCSMFSQRVVYQGP